MAIAGVSCFYTQDDNKLTSVQAVLHQLATQTLALSFFATHYGSLTDDFAYHPNIRNMHMSTLVDDEKREVCDPMGYEPSRLLLTPHVS